MRLLFVTGRFPYPLLRGDQLRAYQQLRLLGRRHDVTLLSFAPPDLPAASLATLSRLVREVHTVPWRAISALPSLVGGLASGDPLQARLFFSPEMRARLRSLLTQHRFELVHFQLARLGQYLGEANSVPSVVDFVDALSLNMRRRYERDASPLRLLARLEWKRLEPYERRVLASASAAVVASATDAAALGADVIVSPNGVDVDEFAFRAQPAAAAGLVMTGNMGYFSNVEGACWFVREVLPKIQAQLPDATLHIVGDRPTPAVLQLKLERGVTVTGRVDDLRPYLVRSAVAVAPTRAGSGQLLKVLEAMAIGTPVVATAVALAGTAAQDGVHALVAGDAADFAFQVVRLLRAPEEARRLALAARRLVEQHYTWEHSVAALELAYERALSHARR